MNFVAPTLVLCDMCPLHRVSALTCVVMSIAVCTAAQLPGENPQGLPAPTGAFGIGRVTVVYEDASRVEPLDPKVGNRRIKVDFWYPADPAVSNGTAGAEYLDILAFERALGAKSSTDRGTDTPAEEVRKQLGAAYDLVKDGGVKTHAVIGAPFASSLRRSPILIFSPGGGMVSELYTSQLEDLASHGYIVAAITHSYDGFLTLFPDGSSVAYDARRWPKIPSLEGEANLNQLEWHTDDMRVVLDELGRSASRLPFAGRLDLGRVGAFGHSSGGIAAAHACQKDRGIMACLNQDGAVAMQPYYLDVRGWGMDQAFMFIERAPRKEQPSDTELAAMKLTRARVNEIRKRLDANRDRALRATGKGSYHVLLQSSSTTHMDFGDLQILGAKDRSERERRERVMGIIRSYTRAFFDKFLMETKSPFLEGRAGDPLVEGVEFFGPAKRPN